MRKGQLKFYKGGGAAQFRLIPPRLTSEGYLEKEGAMLLEVAPGTGRGKELSWDWKRKITFAISVTDINLMFEEEKFEKDGIFHDSEGTPKKLMVTPGEKSGWFLSVAEGKGADRHNVSVSLTDGEWANLRYTLRNMIPYLSGLEDDDLDVEKLTEAIASRVAEKLKARV